MGQSNSTKRVLLSSSKMAVATFSSRILGLVREQAIAAVFGASGVTDAFTIAYRIPNMLRDLFAEGAFSSAFVPTFTGVRLKNEKLAKGLLWSMAALLALITGVISLLLIVYAKEVVLLFTNEVFNSDPERLEITIGLVRIMAPFLVLISLAALFMGTLNTLKIFFVPSFAPALFNIAMIGCIFLLPDRLKFWGYHPVYSLGVGVMLGGFIQMIVQLPLLFKKGYGPQGPFKLISKDSKVVLKRVGIGTIGIAATQINVIITTILATSTVVGAVSWLTFAFRLFQFPVGILSVSIAGSNLVHFSEAWKNSEKEKAINYLSTSYFLSFLTIVPAMALLFALAKESIHLVFERGAFDGHDTAMTYQALKYYLVGLPCYGLYKIFAPTFFALDRPKIPVKISIFSIFCNIIFCVYFTPKYGFWILALGTSLSMILNSVLQAVFLRNLLDISWSFFFKLRILKIIVSGIITYVATLQASQFLFRFEDPFFTKALMFCLSGAFGAVCYGLVLFILGEGRELLRVVRRK
ncbi:putative membrane protein [Halobacteriovorax marinus SJ]|uniref:Probable lipid II flippase MurJ n=1 Tax=Halobacteriovorax marinus (strain ATCC BAA-682 / DSM 15412 / SJ) TaxID=862908 RepID=E1X4L8_HALMS|nr:murein biosynthesis integral membrane protein MurJ [Halobacteriovorax marinus]CBW25448.1 putative membrane protein [Halobacteriovorax marinus SJ]